MQMRLWSVVLSAAFLAFAPGRAPAQHIKLSASLDNLEKTARADSNDPAAHYNLALAYWNAKRWDDADPDMKKQWISALSPDMQKRRERFLHGFFQWIESLRTY